MTRLESVLSEYKLLDAYRSGALRIEVGAEDWPTGWYSDPYFRVSVPLALDIAMECKGANDFKLRYDRQTDFHFVQFDYSGETYIVRWYKTFILHRKSDRKMIRMGTSRHNVHQLVKKKEWWDLAEVASKINDPFPA